jgi:hypothetical protein
MRRTQPNDALIASINACGPVQGQAKNHLHALAADGEPQPRKQEAPFGIHIFKIRDGDE